MVNRLRVLLLIAFALAGGLLARAQQGQVSTFNTGILTMTPITRPTTSLKEGMIYQDTSDHSLYVYSGSGWVATGGGTVTSLVTPYVSSGANINPWRAQASNDAAKGPFNLDIGSFLFTSTYDNVLYLGYNYQAGGSRYLNTEPGFGFSIEQDYEASAGTHYVESYFEYRHTDSTQKRPIFMQWNRADGTMSSFEMRTSGITFSDWVSGSTIATLSQGGTNFNLVGNSTQSADTTLVVGALNSKAGSLNMTGNFQIRRVTTNDWAFDIGGTNAQIEAETNKIMFGGVQDFKAMTSFQVRAARKDTDDTVNIKQAASQTTQSLVFMDNSSNRLAVFGQQGNGHADLSYGSSESVFWTNSTTNATATKDLGISRNASNILEVNTGTPGTFGSIVAAAHLTKGANGQILTGPQFLTELTTIAASATTDTTIQMPANSVVLGVTVRVTTVIPTAATFTVGDSGSAARFSTAAVSVAANSTDPGTKAGAYYNSGALSVRITPDLTPGANSGRVRVTIYYYTITPPTS